MRNDPRRGIRGGFNRGDAGGFRPRGQAVAAIPIPQGVPAVVNATPIDDGELFDGGPPRRLETWLGLHPCTLRKTALLTAIAWLPLPLLSAAQSFFHHHEAFRSFVSDVAVHTRCLIVLPLLILAEKLVAPRLGTVAKHFLDAGLVAVPDRPRFDLAVASTRRLRDSLAAEAGVVVLTFVILAAVGTSVPLHQFPLWQGARGGALPHYSPAGWWHVLVSLPLLFFLFFGWMWRLFLWARFLRLMARLDLNLVPSHPDRAAGLLFVNHSLRAFSVIGFALGAVVAGLIANGIGEGTPLPAYGYVVLAHVVFVILLFGGPLLVFTDKLIGQRIRGVFEYGALAGGLGRRFERRWLARQGRINDGVLEAPDFSATTGLYQVAANVYGMRLVLVDLRGLLVLVAATLLPFVPVLLMAIPFDALLADLAKLLF